MNGILFMDMSSVKNRERNCPENTLMLLMIDSSSLKILDANSVYEALLKEKELKQQNGPFVISSEVKKMCFFAARWY
jgi:hypothetical protein